MRFKNDRHRKAVMAKMKSGNVLKIPKDNTEYYYDRKVRLDREKISRDMKPKPTVSVSIGAIKDKNERAGRVFFSKGTIRSFGSKVEGQGTRVKMTGQTYFITSENTFDGKSRKYTIRRQEKNGFITTINGKGEANDGFQDYSSLSAARSDMRDIIKKQSKGRKVY